MLPKGYFHKEGGKKEVNLDGKSQAKKNVNESNGFFFIIHHRGFGQK